MKHAISHIGVFTSGGDSPGMNTALYAIVKAAESKNITVSGFIKGYEGLIDNHLVHLEVLKVKKYAHQGGTLLKTARSDRFRTNDGMEAALNILVKNDIDGLIAIGGDGTFRGLTEFERFSSIPAIGIPGTIDNDIYGTDYTLGFDTAVNTALQSVDKIWDTAESHNRVFLIEVMGRDSGYIGTYTGLASAADAILIPESTEDFIMLLEKIRHYNEEKGFMIVVSEGDELGVELLSSKILEMNPKADLRIVKLGHVQRGGNPSALDRILGIKYGVFAVDSLLAGKKNKVTGILNNQLHLSSLSLATKKHRLNDNLIVLIKLFSS